jgi:hypothetical protein
LAGVKPDARTAKIAAAGTGYSGSTLDKVAEVLRAEADENTQRKPLSPVEAE